MSQKNVEVVRALAEQWNAGIRSVPTELLDPAVEWESPFSSVVGEPYRGYAGIEQWMRDVDEQFAGWRIDVPDVREIGSQVIQIGTVQGRGRASSVPIQLPFAMVMHFGHDDRITRARIYLDVNEALEAVGLSAQDAHGNTARS
jgi:ketosteroid isomerase-like protein